MSFIPTQVQQAAPPPEEEYVPPPPQDTGTFVPAQVAEPAPAPQQSAPVEQAPDAPPPTGPVSGAINAVSQAVSDFVPDQIEDPLSGWVPDVAAVTTALGQGDLGGAVAPILDYANRPFEYGSTRQGERALDPNRGQVPTPGEILDDPSAIYDVVPGFWNTGGPGAWAVGSDIDTWAEQNPQQAADALARGGGQAVYEDWKASGGLQTTPAGVDNPLDDEQYSGSVLDRIRQGATEVGEFGGSVVDSARQGALTPFLKGMVADIGNDPSFAGQVALGIATGGLSALGGAAGRRGMVGVAETLGRASSTGRAINRAADVALDPLTNSIGLTMQPAKRGIRNIGGLLDKSPASRQAMGIDKMSEAAGEYLAATPRITPAAATPPAVSPGAPPPALNGAAGIPTALTPQPLGGAPLPTNTLYNPPATRTATRQLSAGRGDPYTRPVTTGTPSVLQTPRATTPGPVPPDALAVRGGVWRTASGEAVTQANDISPSLRTTTRRIYDEMMTADPATFWDRFDSAHHTADVDLGADGFYARWRGAMRQGLYLLDDWPEARVGRTMPGVKLPDGSIDWQEVGRLAQSGDKNAQRAMGGKRQHDLFVHRIAGSADPDREVYNLLVNYHLDQHSGRFTGNQYGSAYWKQRAEQISEILRDAGYTPSPQLIQRLASLNVGDLVASELAGRTGSAAMRAQMLARNGVIQMHVPGSSRPIALQVTPGGGPGIPTTTQQIMGALPPPPAGVNAAPSPNQQRVSTSFGYLSATNRQRIVDNLPDDAIMGPDAVPVSLATDLRMREAIGDQFRFNDGSTGSGTLRDVVDQTARELDQWIDMANDPALQVGPAADEFARLSKKFAIDGDVLNAAELAGPQNEWRRNLVIEDILRAGMENALPKAQKSMSQVPGMEVYQSFLDMRRRVQLYNYLNLPRFAVQQHVGNTISTAIAGKPKVALGIFTSLRDYPAVYRKLNNPGKYSIFNDDLQRKIGGGIRRTVTQSDRASLGLDVGGNVEEAMGPFGHMAKVLAPDKLVKGGSVNDIITRVKTDEDEVLRGFRVMNKDLARNVREWSGKYGLPYTDEQINEVVQRFLNQNRVVIDGNTGKPHTTMFGRTAKYEPTYSARDFRDFMRAELPKVAPPTSLTHSDPLELLIRRVGADVSNNIKAIQQAATNEVHRVAFDWRANNLDEFLQIFTMFHFWMTRAGGLYVNQMLRNPWALAAYGRMMDDFEAQLEMLDGPDWMKGWFQFMNTPAGFTVWYSPVDLFSTLLTFADWQMEAGESPFDDLTWLGRMRNHIPFMLNPLLDFAAYAIGAYGPDAQVPDLLGLNRPATMATDLLNLANAEGLLPGWVRAAGIGVDAQGNPVPLQPKKLTELYARVGNGLSSALKEVTGLRPVPIPNTAASQQRSIAYILEQNFRVDYPGLPQEDIDRKVTDALADPGSAEYQRAWRMQADMPYMTGDTPLPGWAEGAFRALISPVQMYAAPEQQFLDSTMKGLEPSGDIPPRNLPTYQLADGTVLTAQDLGAMTPEQQQAMAETDPGFGQWMKEVSWANNAAKYGASDTVETRVFKEQVDGYWNAGDPAINAVSKTSNGIYKGSITEPVSIGGVIYSPEDIAGFDQDTRKALSNQYRDEQGVTWDMIDANYAQRDAYLAEYPNVAAYVGWEDTAGTYHPGWKDGWKAYPGATEEEQKVQYVTDLLATNPDYADYMANNGYDLQSGAIDWDHALNEEAYLASQGIRPGIYDPISSPTMEPLPAPKMQTVTNTVPLELYPAPDASTAPIAFADEGFQMTLVEMQGDWAKVTIGGQEGYVDAGYLQNAPGGYRPEGLTGAIGGVASGGMQGVASLVDAAGSVVGTMFGGGGLNLKPSQTPGFASGQYSVEAAPDGYGVKSTADSDRMWMEDMIGNHNAIVTTDYKGATPGPWYSYQEGHGADSTTHAAYDISCDTGYRADGSSSCPGTPIYAPIAGTVVCSGYGQGTGEALASCTYSQNTTIANPDGTPPAHTVVLDVGMDAAGNSLQLSFNHFGSADLVPGQVIEPGDLLGTMGDTEGGPHIHLEGWAWSPRLGTYVLVDPALIVNGYYQTHSVDDDYGT